MNALFAQLKEYWQGRTDREQILYAVMGVLTAYLLAHFAIIQPLANFHDRSRASYAASMELFRAIEADAISYRELSAGAAQTSTTTQQSMRSIVGSLALTHSISIARLIPGEDGSLTVNIERAETAAVMQWLIDLEERFGIRVTSSSMDAAGGTFVQANFVLRRSGGAS
ncbi:MAG: type II secretion system protein M [Alphaproteobacteria bacterium]|nr:type II secretion system protein M [Alphaproteobacteria bacterium]